MARDFDAWTWMQEEGSGWPEALGSFPTAAEALLRLDATEQGGVVARGRAVVQWHPKTAATTQGYLLADLTGTVLADRPGVVSVRTTTPPAPAAPRLELVVSNPDPKPAPRPAAGVFGERVWSGHQEAIFGAVQGERHVVVTARAGSGKTTTIVECVNRMPADAQVLLVAFNVAIKEELDRRCPNAVVLTAHGLGHRSFKSHWGDVWPSGGDNGRLKELSRNILPSELDRADKATVIKFASWMKHWMDASDAALTMWAKEKRFDLKWEKYTDPDDRVLFERADLFKWVRALLKASRAKSDQIDFDDMPYVPVMEGWSVGSYDYVVIDEAQDWDEVQMRLIRSALAPGGRVIAVGDDRQSIYSFRGADPYSMGRLVAYLRATDRGVVELSLPVSYRCPVSVVELAKQLVPDLEHRDGADAGSVEPHGSTFLDDVAPGDFIISRVNAPLAGLCLQLLKRNIRARIQGRDLGKSLQAIIKQSKRSDIEGFITWLEGWEAREVATHSRNDDDTSIELARDQAAVLRTLAGEEPDTDHLSARIASLFSDRASERGKGKGQPHVVLTSAHRAKGLEAKRVWVLQDTFRRRQEGEESNLYYVAITRSMRALYLVTGVK